MYVYIYIYMYVCIYLSLSLSLSVHHIYIYIYIGMYKTNKQNNHSNKRTHAMMINDNMIVLLVLHI